MYDFERRREGGEAQLPRPSLALTLAEPVRFPLEWTAARTWGRLIPAPTPVRPRNVVVVPGFMATDHVTGRLRAALTADSHRVAAAGVGRMVGLTDPILDGLAAVTARATEGGPVTLIGYSFGGLLARWLANTTPDLVEHVVLLGSPGQARGEVPRVTAMFQRSAQRHGMSSRAAEVVATARRPLPMPVSAVYSTTDGLVPAGACSVEGPDTENVVVPSSHVGLTTNPLAVAVLRDRLAHEPLSVPFSWRRIAGGLVPDLLTNAVDA
jgi:pimeloyl-ACP methyl ester carboxylesterase